MIRKTDFDGKDVGYIVSAREKGFSDCWNEDMVLSAVKGGRFFGYIYEKDGVPSGFLTYSVGLDGVYDLEDLFVEPSERRKGIGGALTARFIGDARLSGGKKIFLEVRRSNVAAIRLYSSFGFIPLSERAKYYADGESATVMLKEL